VGMGLSQSVASSYVELSHAISEGKVKTTQNPDPAKPNAPTKFADFVKEIFAPAFKAAA